MRDGIAETEREAVQELVYLATFGKDAFNVIANAEWVSDGISAPEVSVIGSLGYTAQEDQPGLARTIASLPWVADGVDEGEAEAVVNLGWVGQYSPETANAIILYSWAQDSVSTRARAVIQALKWIAKDHPGEALRIAGMRFLTRLEPADVAAMESLALLSSFRPSGFVTVMGHPTMKAGITDDWAKIVATLYGVDATNPQLVDSLLTYSEVRLEKRVIKLPLAGEVELAIIRLGPGAARSMDLLEHAARSTEAFMGVPFPTRYVGLLFADAVYGSYVGTNLRTHIAMLPRYDVDDESYEAGRTASIIAHEVAHYYWSGNADWIDEGASEFIAILSENARVGRPFEPDNYPCGQAINIATLERLNPSRGDGARSLFRCNYSFGERIFLDLYRSIGESEFKQGFRSLYQASMLPDEDDSTEGTPAGIAELRAAFGNAASTPTVTARWYEKTESYDISGLDRHPVNPDLPSIGGSFDLVGVALSHEDCMLNKRDLAFSIREIPERVAVCLRYSYDVDSRQETGLEIVVWFEDGFPIQRINHTIEAQPEYSGARWSYYVGPSEWNWWAPGRYYIYVYNEGAKVGEAQFNVFP